MIFFWFLFLINYCHLKRLLRPEVLLAAVLWEEAEAINQSKQLLHNFLYNRTTIPANLREVSFPSFLYTRAQIKTIFIQLRLGFRLFTRVRFYRVNIHIGNSAGNDILNCAETQKAQLSAYSCYEHWAKPKTHGK